MPNAGRRLEAGRIGKRGTVVIPARLRKRFRLEEGAFVIAEERPDGILIRPATLLPVETYTAGLRKAEFLLGNATTPADYKAAVAEIRAMGLEPAADLELPEGMELPEKDRPVFLAAVQSKATHFLTGDRKHFGAYRGKTFGGVRIVTPADRLGPPPKSRRRKGG